MWNIMGLILLVVVGAGAGAPASAQVEWKEVDAIGYQDADRRPFDVGATLFVNIVAPRRVADGIVMRIFRGEQAELRAGRLGKDMGDGCIRYDSVLKRLTNTFGRVAVEGEHITNSWLRLASPTTVADAVFFLRFEPKDALLDGPISIQKAELNQYFGHGRHIIVRAPQGQAAAQAREAADAVRRNDEARSQAVDHGPKICVQLGLSEGILVANVVDCVGPGDTFTF